MNSVGLMARLTDRFRPARALAVAAVAAATGLGGCNAGNNNLLEANRALTERNQALTQQNESLQNLNQQLQAALAARDRTIDELRRLIDDLRSGNSDIEARYLALEGRLGNLSFGSLDPTTDEALRQLAEQHSDILEYDAARGMLRFKSDLTFASGSDVVSENARQTLSQLGRILDTGAAAAYDIRIVGHTDTQPISSPTARNHKTNMHLSAHRAISVRDALVSGGVDANRFEVAGRGEFEPRVNRRGNVPENRRVEIFLVRAAGPRNAISPSGGDEGARAPAAAPSRPASNEDMMK